MVGGPNGSGKSTLIRDLRIVQKVPLGLILNPDELEYELLKNRRLDFSAWGVSIEDAELRSFFRDHPLSDRTATDAVSIKDNVLEVANEFHSGYFVAVLCDLLRRKWLAARKSFTFETVMSSSDKLGLFSEAVDAGYRTYLYYVCTDTPVINEERVAARVLKGGHNVPADKIVSRYERSLSHLAKAISLSNRAYLFDNSEKSHRLVAEFEEGKLISVSDKPPGWLNAIA
jgi:predicted ABC-type ATPase